MKDHASAGKANGKSADSPLQCSPAAGSEAMAFAPPPYGIEFVDRGLVTGAPPAEGIVPGTIQTGLRSTAQLVEGEHAGLRTERSGPFGVTFGDYRSHDRQGNLAVGKAAPLQTVTSKPPQTAGANLILQRKCACGAGTSNLTGECAESSTKKMGLQTKLRVNEPGDAYEQEADRVTEQVLAKPAYPDVGSASPPSIQRYTGKESGQAGAVPASINRVLAGPGMPLDLALRQDMEQQFGYDFSRVRVHSGATAEQSTRDVNAHAYTVGHNMVFGAGRFAPNTNEGQRLLAHELTHVVQQSKAGQHEGSRDFSGLSVQRQAAPSSAATATGRPSTVFLPYSQRLDLGSLEREVIRLGMRVPMPPDKLYWNAYFDFHPLVTYWLNSTTKRTLAFARDAYKSVDETEVFVGYEVTIYGEGGVEPWPLYPKTSEKAGAGPPVTTAPKPAAAKPARETPAKTPPKSPVKTAPKPAAVKPTRPGPRPVSQQPLPRPAQTPDEVKKDKEKLASLPPETTQLLGPEESYKPEDYQRLLKIAEKLKKFTPEDLAAYQLLTIRATDNIDLFEKSVDLFIARKEALKKALAEQQRKGEKPPLKEPTGEKSKELTAAGLKAMSEEERYKLAREKTSEATEAQLKYMKEHPGETLKEFAKSATLVNTPETFSAIAKDLKEAANSDANTWARWAAGTGAGAKLSGWLLAVAGVLFVASWLTGVGELATIAAGAAILLGATVSLSLAESELRIKAASQATTPEEFERNVQLAGAARANVVVAVALIVVAAVLHFTAKALFPKTMQKITTSLKNLRERTRLKGSISEIQLETRTEIGGLRGELATTTELAKKNAIASGEALEKLNTEQFVDKLEAGDGGFLDQSKLPPDQKFNFREMLKTPEGRAAIEGYKTKLVNALKADVPAEIDSLAQEYGTKIDQFLKEVEAAKNHDELNAALDKAEGALTEEHAKKFMQEEQQKIVNKNLETALEEVKAEGAKAKEAKPAKPPKPAAPTAPPKPAVPTEPPKPAAPTEPPKPAVPTEPPKPAAPTEPPKPAVPTEPPKPAAPTEPPKPAVPTEPPKPAAPTEPPKPAAPTEPPKPAAPTEPPKPAAPTEPPKPAVPTEPPKPEVPTEPPKPAVPTEPPKPAVPTEPPKPEVPTEPPKPAVPTEPPKPEVPTEPPKPAAPTEPPKPEVPTEPPKPAAPTEPPKPAAPTEPPKPAVPTEPPKPEVPTEPPKPAAPTEPPKPAVPTEPPKPAAPTEPPKPTEQPKVETKEPIAEETAKPTAPGGISVGDEVSIPEKGRSRGRVIDVTDTHVVIKVRSKSASGDITYSVPRDKFAEWVANGEVIRWTSIREYLRSYRPRYRQGQVEVVWERAKQPDGKVYDPTTQKELKWDRTQDRWGQWQMGHRKGHEYAKLVDQLADGKITEEQFYAEYYNPDNYVPQDPVENMKGVSPP